MSTLDVHTLALSTVPSPIPTYSLAVSATGPVYMGGGPLTYGKAALAIFDPASQTVSPGYPLLSSGFLALSPDGSRLYQLNSVTETVAMTATVPSTIIVGTAPMPSLFNKDTGAYDATDNLILLPGLSGVSILSGSTLKVKGILPVPASAVAFGSAGFALNEYDSQVRLSPQVVQFNPVSLQVTGSVSIPFPTGFDASSFIQPAQYGNVFYAPLYFYSTPGNRPRQDASPASLTPASVEIAVIDSQTMTLAAIWPLSEFTEINGFAIAPGGKVAYVAGTNLDQINFDPELLTIDISTGNILKTLKFPGLTGVIIGSSLALSPDGSMIYVTLNGTLYAINTQTMTIRSSVPGLGDGFGLSITLDGQYLYAASAHKVSILSTASLQVTGTIPSAVSMGQIIFVGQ